MNVLCVKQEMAVPDQDIVTAKEIRAEALDKAMRLFWSQGAEHTSYNDLVTATGLSRKALYAIWPDKDTLVREALQCYRDAILSPLLARLDRGAEGLESFWAALERAGESPAFHGCFMVNSGTGPMAGQGEIAALYAAHLDRLEAQLNRAIVLGKAEGKLAVGDPTTTARLAVAVAVQIQTLMAAGHHQARLPALFDLARATCGLTPGVRPAP